MKIVSIRLNDWEEKELNERFFNLEHLYGIEKPLKMSWKEYLYKCTTITSIFIQRYYNDLSDHDKEIIDMVLKMKPR